ncbi:MAG: 50S ribosomal protein L24 [Proteobacteria bacterium]|nr:50S ribosomal protein L24 [Pseudomonadota bacterium]
MQKIRSDDTVVVIAGKDRGRVGKVLKILANDRVLVEGINLVKKHTKPNPQRNIEGGILQKESSIHISNVALLNLTTNQPDRVGIKWVGEAGNKRKVRYFKSNNEVIDVVER